jgi:putative resolvase
MRAKDVMKKYEITRNTLSNWVKSGKISFKKTKSGRYIYMDIDKINQDDKINVIYARVSISGQSDNLKRQIERLKDFSASNGIIIHEILSEIGSGMNYNRLKYTKLINMVLDNKVDKIIIEYNDRLVRFGLDGLENIFKKFNTELIIINKSDEGDLYKEITDDLISIIHHFSSKMYSLRKSKKKIVDILNENN